MSSVSPTQADMAVAAVPPAAVHVVDDDAQVRRSIWFFLDAAGYAPRVFGSGTDLLAELDQLPLAPVLLDLEMAELDGFEILARLKERVPAAPVIIITGHGDIPRAVKAMKMGAADFVQKPFDENALLNSVEASVESLARSTEQARQARDAERRVAALSTREREVLSCLAAGRSNKVIAHDLGLSPRTVEMHRANMMHRLGARNLLEALKVAQLARLDAVEIVARATRNAG